MSPPNPSTYSVDSGRIYAATCAPEWLSTKTIDIYCVPFVWHRALALPNGRELEAYFLWRSDVSSDDWRIDPKQVLEGKTETARKMQSLMFTARMDSKQRLKCSILTAFADLSETRTVWVNPELDSLSIWTSFAFQYIFSRLELE